MLGIIEIGSNNTKTHIYEGENLIYDNNKTIEFKKNYSTNNKIMKSDLDDLYKVIDKALEYTDNIYIYGCSIFRSITESELDSINEDIKNKYNKEIEVVSQEDEASLTALGCYSDTNYDGNMCIFIGGGGSIELIFVHKGEVIDKKFYNFGVVDITSKFPSLKEDIPECSLDEVCSYVDKLMNDLETTADVLVLAGGDHLYWFNNAKYELFENTLYRKDNQKYMIPIDIINEYDIDAFSSSLDRIRNNSDNPNWFDGSRAMRASANVVAQKIKAKYVVPTRVNMEDGLKNRFKL